MAVYIPSFQVLQGRPRFFLPSGFQLIIISGNRVGSILSTWPYQMSCFRVISSSITIIHLQNAEAAPSTTFVQINCASAQCENMTSWGCRLLTLQSVTQRVMNDGCGIVSQIWTDTACHQFEVTLLIVNLKWHYLSSIWSDTTCQFEVTLHVVNLKWHYLSSIWSDITCRQFEVTLRVNLKWHYMSSIWTDTTCPQFEVTLRVLNLKWLYVSSIWSDYTCHQFEVTQRVVNLNGHYVS